VSDEPYPYRGSDRKVFWWLLFGLVVLFGALYAAGYLFSSDRVPRGTTVGGISIGGMSPAAAEQRLANHLRPDERRPIELSVDGERARMRPATAGLGVDVPASVRQAGAGRSWDPARIWDYFSGGDDLEPVVTVDDGRLEQAVADLAQRFDEPAKDGGVRFVDGEARASYPSDGVAVDREATAGLLRRAFLSEQVVDVPVRVAEPEISKDEVSRAMDRFANPAVSAPVTYQLGGEDVVLRPEDFTPALSMVAEDGDLVPRLDEKVLLERLEPRMRTLSLAPQDASVQLIGGKPTVVPGKKGVTFDPDDVTGSFLRLVVGRDQHRQLAIRSVVARPEFTTREATALRITEKVSEFTTYFPHADYRNTNLGRAAELISGTVLKPGDTFSLNDTVGERTAQNGFTKGFIISDGVYKEDFGGGVSQVATTTFNAAFFAGMKDVQHKPHSFYIDRYPVGREATVAWPSVDLKFQNTTPYGVLVQAWIEPSTPSSQGAMHVRMWSTKYWDIVAEQSDRYDFTSPQTRHLSGDDCVPNDGYGGFDIDVFRLFYKHGSKKLDHRETMHTTYTPSDTVVCS
jgi:vancomycin resistance protein YoaR